MRNWTKGKSYLKSSLFILIWLICIPGCESRFMATEEEDGFFKAADTEGKTAMGSGKDSLEQSGDPDGQFVYVHVCGQVKEPGLYSFPAGSRVGDAVKAAGGFTKKADTDAVNLAALVEDGQQIYVPDASETGNRQKKTAQNAAPADSKEERTGADNSTGDRVNINTADLKALTSLSGIGDSKASAIIEYRENRGAFSAPEEIRNVPGIGDAIYDRIKDLITV